MAARRRILFFGGTFNPPTLAHEEILRACLGLPGFDEVWIMPSGDRLDKKVPVSEEHRLRMLEIMKRVSFGDDPRLQISEFELKLPRPTEMSRTMHELARKYPETDFWFACGGDSYRTMQSWAHADSFIPSLHVVVFTEYEIAPIGLASVMQLHLPASVHDVSSSEIRATLARGGDASSWCSEAILDYCLDQQLYKP